MQSFCFFLLAAFETHPAAAVEAVRHTLAGRIVPVGRRNGTGSSEDT